MYSHRNSTYNTGSSSSYGPSRAYSGGGGASLSSSYKSRQNLLQCSHCGCKSHSKEQCYKIVGYPADFKSKKKGSISSASANQVETSSQSNHRTSPSPTPLQQSATFFTQEQYQQILQLLSKPDGDRSVESPAKVASVDAGNSPCASLCSYDPGEWIIDTGATHHITSFLASPVTNNTTPGDSTSQVHLPNGNTVAVSHIGSTSILANQTISNVLYLPDFQVNLVSVSKLTKELKCMVAFFPDFCVFQDLSTGQVKGIGKKDHGLYILTRGPNQAPRKVVNSSISPRSQSHSTSVAKSTILPSLHSISICESADVWHKRFGHAPIDVKNVFSITVKTLRTDNGCEFFSHAFKSLLGELGIVHQTICVYTPQQNGVAERKHRTILNMAMYIRFQASIPLTYWGECVSTVVYILNRLPSRVLQFTSPFERNVIFQEHLFPFKHAKVASNPIFLVLALIPSDDSHCVFLEATDSLPHQISIVPEPVPEDSTSPPFNATTTPHHPPVIPAESTRRSTRASRPPIWLQDFVTKPRGNTCLYPLADQLTYSRFSTSYQQVLRAYSTICEPVSYKEAASDPAWVKAMQLEIDALQSNKT
ncbi:uncharacterized protein [Solanum tuberosum]|uniref:uncharacterized protein n=1 Tax=Solanum tuberosum TaxID=4113 RepID=UPI00073A1144|nr:PREDICTED: uncharacterized protein LOC107059543 [Solanum tuberosum]